MISGDRYGEVSGEPLPILMRYWRARRNPRDIPGLPQTVRRGTGLTQQDVAHLAGVSVRWYRQLENGVDADYSADLLDRVATALGLSPAERATLYLRAVGRPPAPSTPSGSGASGEWDQDLLQWFLDNQEPVPAFATDLCWDVVAHNSSLRRWFPWVEHGGNQMRWVFLDPSAREQLVNWPEDWARPFLGQLRYERAHHPEDVALAQLERDILTGSPAARALWGRPELVEHSHGEIRRLKLPYHQGREVAVRIVTMRPIRTVSLCVNLLVECSYPGGSADA
ncbi:MULTISPECIES: helix-turn-helix domain-containing protein [unclassified Streptomyces]|uniref:helix-turn-helix domain-containing protein n=1 Tax=unclassified Streptomyces TaxID=2593676 RepID=UPI001EF0E8CB|nr:MULTISPECIES: helix-turn-helix domain-containing protein [unclassified Streptomyces]